MTKIKLCGLKRPCDMEAANELRPDYIGFVFAKESRRYVTYEQARALKACLHPSIRAVGVFVDEDPEKIANLAEQGVIDMIQLHGKESDSYLTQLRKLTSAPIIQAFRVRNAEDVRKAQNSPADHILLDAGAGEGMRFDWQLIRKITRPFFLAGGLSPENVAEGMALLHPFAVDVSSGIETDGLKDKEKMAAFTAAVRAADASK